MGGIGCLNRQFQDRSSLTTTTPPPPALHPRVNTVTGLFGFGGNSVPSAGSRKVASVSMALNMADFDYAYFFGMLML